jgi:hypothetical protein
VISTIWGSSLGNWLHVTTLTPSILIWFLDFWKCMHPGLSIYVYLTVLSVNTPYGSLQSCVSLQIYIWRAFRVAGGLEIISTATNGTIYTPEIEKSCWTYLVWGIKYLKVFCSTCMLFRYPWFTAHVRCVMYLDITPCLVHFIFFTWAERNVTLPSDWWTVLDSHVQGELVRTHAISSSVIETEVNVT